MPCERSRVIFHSFYPIFPVPLDLAHEVNLDVTHSELLHLDPPYEDDEDENTADPSKAPCAPDVLVLPSRLKHFSKVRSFHLALYGALN